MTTIKSSVMKYVKKFFLFILGLVLFPLFSLFFLFFFVNPFMDPIYKKIHLAHFIAGFVEKLEMFNELSLVMAIREKEKKYKEMYT